MTQVPLTFSTFTFCEMCSETWEDVMRTYVGNTFVSDYLVSKAQRVLARRAVFTRMNPSPSTSPAVLVAERERAGFLVFLSGNKYHLEMQFII